MGRVGELGLLCVPDLTWRAGKPSPPLPVVVRVRPPSACDGCAPPEAGPALTDRIPIPVGLDARAPDDLAEIIGRQIRLVQIADLRRRFVVLLDVPSGMQLRGITDWRSRFESSFAAAYHPWLGVPRPAAEAGGSVAVPASSFAAGIIAARERRFGLPWGPANEIARGAVLSSEVVTDAMHDQLHLLGVNVYRAERDGFRLSAARTLSTDPDYRQLSIRRLMTMLALALERQTQWLVFEPNATELRARLTHTVTQFLRDLQRQGSFAGVTERESFFVRCDDSINPPESLGQGRLLAEIGVAPASPLEYLVLRISQDVDGTISVVSDRG
jgi:phage tail sheath protein FI